MTKSQLSSPTSMQQLSRMVVSGFQDWKRLGDVYVKENEDLILFNYTHKAMKANRWNWLEMNSRGLILEKATGRVVARPFEKFFNWNEGGRKAFCNIDCVVEKVDGSLGIVYFYKSEWRVATRGSLDSEQASWAKLFLDENIDVSKLDTEWTYLVEIVYPDNRIVVDYNNREFLSLLGARHNEDGGYLNTHDHTDYFENAGFVLPVVHPLYDPEQILEWLPKLSVNYEGYVAVFENGKRFKFKGQQYLELHRIVTDLTPKRVLDAYKNGTYEDLLANIPEEFGEDVRAWSEKIELRTKRIEAKMDAPYREIKKMIAEYLKEQSPDLMGYILMKLKGQDPKSKMYEKDFHDEWWK